MRIGLKIIAVVVFLFIAAAACTGRGLDDDGVERGEVQGPALVMFYTDN